MTFENPIRILETSIFSSSHNNQELIYRETPIWQWHMTNIYIYIYIFREYEKVYNDLVSIVCFFIMFQVVIADGRDR